MRRSLSATLIALLLLGVVASTASACINDREIDSQERFFKSSYIDKPTAEPAPNPSPSPADDRLMVWGGVGAGAALLLAAFASVALGITVPRKT
jgi:hypothetical protein